MFGVIYSARASKKASDAVMKNQMDNIANQIKALEVKQDKHNQVIERTYNLEKAQAETSRDIKTLYNHVDEIKGDIKEIKGDMDTLNKSVNEVKECEIRLEGKMAHA